MDDFCQGCGRDLDDSSPATAGIPIREDDTGLELVVCPTCCGQLEGVTLL